MAKKIKPFTSGVEQYASKSVLVFSGSLLVLSVSLNNAGLGKIVDAYSKSIVHKIESQQQCKNHSIEHPALDEIEERLKAVELLAHKSTKKEPGHE